ncbi:DUF4303 domain-containing protein [Leptospira sp. 201903070]|jgi:Domain of unknown function (DUF4303)|uniref:DUF4303 domain-containing protein n=1 Tax=Leptospira ainlahdjerensis TaxID=2810033 RepID=A0ABS2UAM0_9LEPT|nr:DUF4303 domain-containing protein [Leptospira ainlahdjerensis]MBM9577416.1 DUF4303 domain-containing protein [Leptospira ainlahdjerensis]
MFDIPKLTEFALLEIEKFSKEHPEETFYAFAIDASLLCLNSLEAFEKSLKEYSTKWPKQYDTEEKISKLKYNPGDWAYQGFVNFRDLNLEDEEGYRRGPFDDDLYEEHYGADDETQKTTEYAKAIGEILESLKNKDAFRSLKKIPDFKVMRVEHNY